MREDYPIVGSYNNQRISEIDSERTVNMFEFHDKDGKKPTQLISTSGLINNQTNFGSQTRGFRSSFVYKGESYHSAGSGVFKVGADNTSQLLFSFNNTSSDVSVDANTFQIMWVNGSSGWVYDTDVDLAVQITDAGFNSSPTDLTMLDNFAVVVEGGTPNFQLSEVNDWLVWSEITDTFTVNTSTNVVTVASALNYANLTPVTVSNSGGALPNPLVANNTADPYYIARINSTTFYLCATKADVKSVVEGDPSKAINITTAGTGTHTITNNGELQQGSISTDAGNLIGCQTLHRNLFLFAENFTEVWNNQGVGDNLPFRRINSLLLQYGCASRKSIAVGFDRLYFLSRQEDGLGPVMEIRGTQVQPISDLALDYQLAQYDADNLIQVGDNPDISDPSGFVVKENGIIFYRLNFTKADHTFVYNATLSSPQRRIWHEEEMLDGSRHVAATHAYFNGKNYVGHYSQPILYLLDENEPTNDGEIIRRMRIGKPIYPKTGQRLQIDRFSLDLLQGQVFSTITDIPILAENGPDLLAENGDILIIQNDQVVINSNPPVVYLSISKDGGQSYGYQVTANMGKTGARTFETTWRKIGRTKRGQAFVPQIEFYEKIKFVILGAVWDYQILPE